MSKRKRTSKVDKWIKEGRGTGSGADYQPWLKVQNVSSLGRSTRLKGIKTSRQHEFLLDLERNYFYISEANDESSDDSSGDSELKLGQEKLTIPYVAWSSATASNNVMKVVLEEAGYDVNLKQVNSGAMYTAISDGSADASVCIWLPHTDASYWKKYKEDLVHLGPNLEGAPLGLVVPEYMDIDSIEDLAENKNSVGEKTEWTITGIEPGAG